MYTFIIYASSHRCLCAHLCSLRVKCTLPRASTAFNIGIFFTELSVAKSRSDALSLELEESRGEVANLNECLVKKDEDLNQTTKTLKEKVEEIGQIQKLLENEQQAAIQMKEEIELQKTAIGGEIEEKLSNVKAERMVVGNETRDQKSPDYDCIAMYCRCHSGD